MFEEFINIFKQKKKKIPAPWAKYYTDDEMNIEIPDISMYDQLKKSCEKFSDHMNIWGIK